MKRKLEVLLGVMLASALALSLGGCVVSAPDGDDADDDVTAVGEAKSALVGSPGESDPTRSTSGNDQGGNGSLAKPGTPGMADPQPTPWKPPPSGPPADPSKEH